MQVPTCRIDPLRGARINVIGHLNVMESAKRYKDSGKPFRSVVYTSSAAITGYAKDYKDHDKNPLDDDAFHVTKTHYGVFKTANEGNSRIYWQDHQLSSFGLRPHTVFGVGREVGLTSGPTKAIKAAILGRKYQIGFTGKLAFRKFQIDLTDFFLTGKTSFNFVEDVAKIIVDLSQKETQGFYALNMAGPIMSAEEYLALLHKCIPESKQLISIKENAPTLPLAYNFSQKGLDKLLPGNKYTSVEESINKIANAFRELHKNGNLHDRDLVD